MMLSAASSWLREGEHTILSTGDAPGVFAAPLEEAGYRILHLPFRKNLAFFRDFAALIRAGGYDLVHLHPERASFWHSLAIRLWVSRTLPVVRTVHHLFRFDGPLRLRKLLERQLMKHAFGVKFLSNSPSGQRNELRRFHMDNELAPNWYDDSVFTPPLREQREAARNALGWSSDTTVFLSLGGNWGYKNYDRIVDALALIPENLNLLYVQVGVQGDGCPLETQAKRIGVAHRLHCAGVVPDALPYLRAADAYLMPSSEEGFGVAAVEAMAAGLPAILSDVEALCDFGETVSDIRYVEPNPQSIAQAMMDYAHLPTESRIRIGQVQATEVRKHYGRDVGPAAYLKVWRKLAPQA